MTLKISKGLLNFYLDNLTFIYSFVFRLVNQISLYLLYQAVASNYA
jgi:hypothetical protein